VNKIQNFEDEPVLFGYVMHRPLLERCCARYVSREA
jgi:hypothetical protein